MLYVRHDFYSNFNAGINSGDNELIMDIIVNELSNLIIYNDKSLFELFSKVGIHVNKKSSDEKIVNTIANNIGKNIKLAKGLAFLISKENSTKTINKVVEKKGKKEVVKKKKEDLSLKQIDLVKSGLVGLGDTFENRPTIKKEFVQNLMNEIKVKSKIVKIRNRKHKENTEGKYLLLGLLMIGAAVGIYYYIKHKNKMADGGLIDDNIQDIPTEPVINEVPIVDKIEIKNPLVEV